MAYPFIALIVITFDIVIPSFMVFMIKDVSMVLAIGTIVPKEISIFATFLVSRPYFI